MADIVDSDRKNVHENGFDDIATGCSVIGRNNDFGAGDAFPKITRSNPGLKETIDKTRSISVKEVR